MSIHPFARLRATAVARALALLAAFLPAPVAAQHVYPESPPADAPAGSRLHLELLGSHASGIFDEGAAEIVAYDPATRRLFVVNGGTRTVDVLDASNPSAPTLAFRLDVSPYGADATSVAVRGGLVAVAVPSESAGVRGQVVFFDVSGAFVAAVRVGFLPDMLTFTPDGTRVLVANEGEPRSDYVVDGEGSVSVIDVSSPPITQADVRVASFRRFNGTAIDPQIRIFGPGASVAQDLEPEYIAVSADSRTAWVTLQENNALAIVDVQGAFVRELVALGTKGHGLPANALDASDEDGGTLLRRWPVRGMYQPDAIAAYEAGGATYLVTANEGDAREYDAFAEEERVGDLALDPAAFPNAAALQAEVALGRLNVTLAGGDPDGDGDFDGLFAFGGRSFSIWSAEGRLVFDSGDQLERITAAALPTEFNSDNTENDSFDSRSDNKGPEPEGVAVATLSGRTYAFIALERVGGIFVYDVTDPAAPAFIEYANNRDFSGDPEEGTAGDLGPEGLLFIPAAQSPIGRPLLAVANEVSGTTTIYLVTRR